MSINPSCYGCVCSVCTGRYCRLRSARYGLYRFRCARCVLDDDMHRILDCDFFQSKYTLPRHFKIKRRWRRKGELEKRLDLIMQHLGIVMDDTQ